MKKIFLLLLTISLVVLTLVGCEKNKNGCLCGQCDPSVCTCNGDCTLNPDGTCNCEGCPCHMSAEKVYVETRESGTSNGNVTIKIKRPELVGITNKSLQQNINNLILDSVKPYSDEISDISEGFTTADTQDDMIKNKKYSYEVNYKTYTLDNYLSLVVIYDLKTGNSINTGSTGLFDGLRSSKWKETYVVNTADPYENEPLKVEDVCSFSDCRKVMAEEVNKQAEQEDIDIILGNGITEVPENQRFYINGQYKTLVLYFEPGTITKYSLGEREYTMPFKYNSSTQKFER